MPSRLWKMADSCGYSSLSLGINFRRPRPPRTLIRLSVAPGKVPGRMEGGTLVSRIRSFSAGLARRYASTALAIVLEKTFDRCAVDRFKRNAAESEPGQEVTGSAPKATDMLAGNPFTNAEIVDEHQPCRAEVRLQGEPSLAPGSHIFAVLFAGGGSLFMRCPIVYR